MKKIVLVFAFLLTISFQINAQWFWQNPLPQGNHLYSISIPSDNLIYAVTGNGLMLNSTDGGNSWIIDKIDSISTYSKIHFINAVTGFRIGNGFYRTTDGGQNWNKINLSNSIKSFFFLNQTDGWFSGNGFYRTTDSGESWDSISNAAFTSFYFINSNFGFGVDYASIKKTTDGGYTWLNCYSGTNYLYALKILNDSTIIAVGNSGGIVRSENYGETWESVFSPTSEHLYDIESISETTAWIVGNGGVILKSTNGGIQWFPQTAYTNAFLFSLKFSSDQTGYIVGQFGKIFKTTDSGNNWINISNGYYEKLNYIYFVTPNIGWVGGDNGIILKTTDYGNDWIIQNSQTSLNIDKIFFNNETQGWFSASGRLYRTTNGGQDWSSNFIGQNSFSFIDELTGWLISNYKLYKTTDGGDNWLVINDDFIDFGKIYFISNNTGWAIKSGAFNRIKTTIDGGMTWGSEISLSIVPSDYVFINENKGWIVGYDGKIIFTIDGGITWYNQNSGVTNTLSKVNFADEMNGYILPFLNQAEKTFVLKTNDGGLTWDKQYLEFCSHINLYGSSLIENNVGWLVGDYGTILHTTNGGVTFIEEENNFTQPKEFLLQQNYPNPFNPSTSIQYSITSTQFVTLKVYDLLGREVATLVNEDKPAGSHKVVFKSTVGSHQLANGVYFYRLQAGNYIETKKMLLIK